jgi:DNA ligase-1
MKKYNGENPAGFWMSEKYDGVFAEWDGVKLTTRRGNEIAAPDWFKDDLPESRARGELWICRGSFQAVVSIVRKRVPVDSEWKQVRYMVFAVEGKNVVLRGNALSVKQIKCDGRFHLENFRSEIISGGGEGIVIRKSVNGFPMDYSEGMFKDRPFMDDEAEIVGYKPGGGKYDGLTGALICRTKNGIEFNVGSGLTDEERKEPPEIGVLITYAYNGLTDSGKPRFPRFVAIRDYE